MYKRIVAFFSCVFLLSNLSFSQGIANVSPLTGTAIVNIPIYTVSSGRVAVPVTLSYSTNGVKVKDVEGTAGMGWNLEAGGQVSRMVRGLPDDCTKDTHGNARLGWMSSSNTAPGAISSFTIQNDGDGNCTKETNDVSYINSHFSYTQDTEPDIFYVDAPGLSCQLVYSRADSAFHPVTLQDLIITYTKSSTSGLIASFTITNDQGIKYSFAAPDSVIQTTIDGNNRYFATQFKQYQYGIKYSDTWSLTRITDPNGNSVQLTYHYGYTRYSSDRVALYLPNTTKDTLQYYVQEAVTPRVIATIRSANNNGVSAQKLSLVWTNWSLPNETNQTMVSSISGFGRSFQFNYSAVADTTKTRYTRAFLRNFADVGCATPVNYQFSYAGVVIYGTSGTTILPDSNTNKLDYWGYMAFNGNDNLIPKVWINPSDPAYTRYKIYNPSTGGGAYSYSSTNGVDRSVSGGANADVGCLTSIKYAQGGGTSITYEPNTYDDQPSGASVKGGGVRVLKIIDSNSTDTTKNIVRNYAYKDPNSLKSSGKPISLPLYAFSVPYSGSATGQVLWDDVTVLSENDLSSEDHSIVYGYVTLSQTGAGSTQYHYRIPATNFDSTATAACSGCTAIKWRPTVSLSSRTNCSLTYGPVKNDIYAYPFIPNTNFDFERGLPLSVIAYNDAGAKVSETDYTYQQYAGPVSQSTITAFNEDDNPSPDSSLVVKTYNKYTIYYNAGELSKTTIQKIYDSPAVSRNDTVTYTYGSTHHALLTKQTATNSDGSTLITNISYVKDYSPADVTNPYIKALYHLQLLNINAPVETYQQVKRGSTTVTTGASLTLYRASANGSITNYLPSIQYKMVTPDGGSFTPFSINNTAPSISEDSKYFNAANYDAYDNTGALLTADDDNKHIQTSLTDHISGKATATFSNAAYSEVAFDDFDSQFAAPVNTFTITGSGFAANGSHSGNAYGLNTTQTISTTVTKNAIALNYIFSVWINAAAGSHILYITLNGGTATSYTYLGAGSWKYYEFKIPVSGISTSSITLSMAPAHATSLDDILFYPEIAQASTAGYDPVTYYKLVATNTNGISAYYTSDTWGRLLFRYDQDKNIVERKTYFTYDQIANGLTPDLTYSPHPAIFNNVTHFSTTPNPRITGTIFTWDFGDGSPPVSGLSPTQAHTYTSAGTDTVTITASHPLYNTRSFSLPVVVTYPPISPELCACGVVGWNCETGGRVVGPNVCGFTPPDEASSYYTITSIDGPAYGTVSYNWQVSYDNGNTWAHVGTNSSQYINLPAPRPTSHIVRCTVTTSTGQAGSSSVIFSVVGCSL
jgi:hypothetical protein